MSTARHRLLLFLAFLLGLTGLVAAGREDATAAGPVAITEAPPLTWGFKASWRNYAGQPTVADGAALHALPGEAPNYQVEWQFADGSYDEDARVTTLAYEGSAHWVGHFDETKGIYLLDVTIADPQITISADSAVLSAEMTSRERSEGDPKIVDYGRVDLENLDVLGVTPTVAGGTATWTGIPTALTEEGSPAFAGFYRPAQVLDPLGFSYTGPGGAPDFSEHFDREGQPRLKSAANKLFIQEPTTRVPASYAWVDSDDLISHFVRTVKPAGVSKVSFEAFDLEAMEPLGEPFLMTPAQAPSPFGRVLAFDTNEDRLLYQGSGETGITRFLRFDDATDSYEAGTIADPQMSEESFIGETNQGLGWNQPLDLGYRVEYLEATGEWQLLTYKEGADGTWTRHAYPIPAPVVAGEVLGPAQHFEPFGPFERVYATASDGSMIVLGNQPFEGGAITGPPTVPAAFRLKLDEATETVAVEPLPASIDAGGSDAYGTVKTGADGRILLVQNSAAPGNLVSCRIGADDHVTCDPPASIEANVEGIAYKPDRFAIDPESGVAWFAGTTTQQLAAFAGGSYLGGDVFAEVNPSGGPIVAGSDHTLYVQSNDGGPKEFNGSKTWGWAKLESLGTTATVTRQPQPASVALAAGEASKAVSFTAAATGTPTPTRQWQVKAPGAPRFTNLAGASGETLSVAAEAGMGGTEYRAVFTNTAGKVAGQAATLTVNYAPRVAFDLADAGATEGQPATFSLIADASPEPTVTWQYRVGGFWQTIDPEDDNFEVDGDSLTVSETNTEQSGALFRAKLTNSVGSTFSRAAKLTVTPRVQIPEGGIAVTEASLDWLGNEVVQTAPPFGGSNYLSAGASDGKEATYHAEFGDAAVWQVSAAGAETLASWRTRAAHIADGGSQLVRLYGGTGLVEADGSAVIDWHAAFSVNFYGGLVPFTVTDPELTVDADGSGQLTATLNGCASSQVNPDECTPLTPAADVVLATFHDAEIDPAQPLTIEPDYHGVTVDVEGTGAEPQVRTGPDWGAWPQSFVDFQLETGLSSYWYSSGGAADPDKPPLPLTLKLDGGIPPAEPPIGKDPGTGGGGGTEPAPSPKPEPKEEPKGKPAKVEVPKTAALDRRGVAKVATVACPAGGSACQVVAPDRLMKRIAGKRYVIGVSAPAKVKAGAEVPVKVRLSKGARVALGDGRLKLRLRIVVRAGGRTTTKVVTVTIVG